MMPNFYQLEVKNKPSSGYFIVVHSRLEHIYCLFRFVLYEFVFIRRESKSFVAI